MNERNAIKDFVVERKLLDLNEMIKKDRLRTKEEKDISVMLKPFARFLSIKEYEDFISGVAK